MRFQCQGQVKLPGNPKPQRCPNPGEVERGGLRYCRLCVSQGAHEQTPRETRREAATR